MAMHSYGHHHSQFPHSYGGGAGGPNGLPPPPIAPYSNTGGGAGSSGGAASAASLLPVPPALDPVGKQKAIEAFARRELTLPSFITTPTTLRERSLVLRPAIGPSAASPSAAGGSASSSAGPGPAANHHSSIGATAPAFGVLSLSWAADGRRLASSGSNTVSPAGPPPPFPPASPLAATVAANQAAALEERSVIRIWTPEHSVDSRSTIELRGHTDHIEQVQYHPHSLDILASTGWDKTVKVWDTRISASEGKKPSKHVLDIQTRSRNLNMKYHPSGNYIAIGDRMDDVTLYDLRTGKELGYICKDELFQINRFTWSSSGDLFFLTCGNGEIRILNSRSLSALDASSTTAAADGAGLAKRGDILDWPILHTISAHHAIARNVQLDPLGRFILSSGHDACVNLFTTASPYSTTAFATMLDADGDFDFSSDHDDARSGFLPPDFTLVNSFTEFDSPAQAVGFSADGEMWAAGGDQGWVEVASTTAPHTSLLRLPYTLGSVKAIAFNPNASHPTRAHVLAYAGEESADAVRSFATAAHGGENVAAANAAPSSGSASAAPVGPTVSQIGAVRKFGFGGTIRIVGLKGSSQ
ncbi:hypothetical protein OC846_003598 [Tilletia horrida]|uniref:Uncharacterized protein n=1 Tax=Tilletia horrida TaxID=155126 RepID=A0AAN6GPE4_9BASI|nr:hypothetical protein OC846_003598 [Tilletia horrida]KAK0550891.1 hypothetical protein OC845_002454 [Tilletia horrida]KAK0565733.1 hypothetical protein OC861_003603 [Tilletia horrida]